MASTDDAMEAQPRCQRFRVNESVPVSAPKRVSKVEAAQRGIIGRWSAATPGRNGWRSVGHGKRRAPRK
jgi:hypothetical protein